MWDDCIIGTGNKLSTACALYRAPDGPSISHNAVSFWITDCVLGIGMTIMKDTPEGRTLQDMLFQGTPDPAQIEGFLAAVALRHTDPELVVRKIKQAQAQAFLAGQDAKAAELRACLGLR